ncbi:hypothetical protein [Sphingobacterium kitahiroshimense]|uniref:Uncharacterized protein n=1 Tax=Sphingobacterium kitahiroshimense TaxID=470446 RepID=A0ABV0C3D2_9SPHI
MWVPLASDSPYETIFEGKKDIDWMFPLESVLAKAVNRQFALVHASVPLLFAKAIVEDAIAGSGFQQLLYATGICRYLYVFTFFGA